LTQIHRLFCNAPTNGNDWASSNMPTHPAFAQSNVVALNAENTGSFPAQRKWIGDRCHDCKDGSNGLAET